MKQVFEHIAKTPDIKFKHAKGMRDIFGKEFHQYHEIFLFISGDVSFTTEQETFRLTPYTLIIIPANTFHSFHVHGDEADYERYLLNFYNVKDIDLLILKNMDRISVISSPPNQIINDLISLDHDKYSDFEKELLLQARLTSILIEIGHIVPATTQITTKNSKITTACLKYINQNIHERITVDSLSKALNYSRSSITHAFSSDLKIPLYKYIIEKKLMHAHIDILNGMLPSTVCQKYSFSDYSCFYRHYKKRFGVSPSARIQSWA